MTEHRDTPIEIQKEDFKKIGYQLIDTIANFFDNIDDYPVTKGESPLQLQEILGTSTFPRHATPAEEDSSRASELIIESFLVQWSSQIHGVYYFIPSSHWCFGRFIGFSHKSECWCTSIKSHGHRN